MVVETRLDQKEIMEKLARLQTEINQIREYLEDIPLTKDDLESINEANDDLEKGKTRRL